ncbi:SRPBCC family protein [Nocardia jiangsuensis]|uniref:SRPBCC family protein n=1 Tax=Nocardia jiangsuensis TaxID=1691563 RepID=A0ABV8DNC9_9NOCA
MNSTIERLAPGLTGVAAGTAALAALYLTVLRRPCLTWGATDEEVAAAMPGDELLPDAGIVATRAVTVDAPPAAIWPWLVQLGPGRGGAYTYDWIENLFGLDMHSADTVLPQFQELAAGDTIALGSGPTMRAMVVEPERHLVFAADDRSWIWAFGLSPFGSGTRLVSRNRIAAATSAPGRLLTTLVMEPGSLLMERKMLLGIKARAERTPAVDQPTTAVATTR